MATLRSTVSAWPCSSKAMTTTAPPRARTLRACSRKACSPSLRLSELATPLPCRHLSPASNVDQRELSTMIGRRATSGSVASRFRKRVMAASESSRSASMFTSSRFAPPRTCSSATSTAPAKSPDSMSRLKRAEPVTFVRSPMTTKLVSGPISNGSMPLNRVLGRALGRHRPGGGNGRLAVQGVEDRLHQQVVHAAVAQAPRRLRVALVELVVGDGAEGGIVDLRRDRESDVGRAQGARDEALPVRGDRLPRDLGAGLVHLVDVVLEAEVALGDGRGGEGGGGDDVGARVQVGAVRLLDQVGPREAEHVGVALERPRMVRKAVAAVVGLLQLLALEHGPGRAVEDQDPLREEASKLVRWVLIHWARWFGNTQLSPAGLSVSRGGKKVEARFRAGTGPL